MNTKKSLYLLYLLINQYLKSKLFFYHTKMLWYDVYQQNKLKLFLRQQLHLHWQQSFEVFTKYVYMIWMACTIDLGILKKILHYQVPTKEVLFQCKHLIFKIRSFFFNINCQKINVNRTLFCLYISNAFDQSNYKLTSD